MRLRSIPLLVLTAALLACGARSDRASIDPSNIPIHEQPVSVVLEWGAGALPSGVLGNSIFFAGQQDQQYAIRLTNNTNERLEVVVTVDGRDVVSGDLGDYADQRGYIIEPFDNLLIDGFRQSQ